MSEHKHSDLSGQVWRIRCDVTTSSDFEGFAVNGSGGNLSWLELWEIED